MSWDNRVLLWQKCGSNKSETKKQKSQEIKESKTSTTGREGKKGPQVATGIEVRGGSHNVLKMWAEKAWKPRRGEKNKN